MSLESHGWTQRATSADEVTGLLCLSCSSASHFSQASEACIIRRSLGIQHKSMLMLKRKGPTHERQDGGCNSSRSSRTGFLRLRLAWGEGEMRHHRCTLQNRNWSSQGLTHIHIFNILPARKKAHIWILSTALKNVSQSKASGFVLVLPGS